MTLLALLLATGATLSTPPVTPADTTDARQELMNDINVLERKVIGLAQAMDEKQDLQRRLRRLEYSADEAVACLVGEL